MNLFKKITEGQEKIAVVGLGYVGMPIAVAFARKVKVIGFDVNSAKVCQYQQGIDPTREVGNEIIAQTTVDFTSDETRLQESRFIIVAVPTPVNTDHTPDLRPIESASRLIGRNLRPGTIVVYESTVYPGVTEEICVPILEAASGLVCGKDFKVGYSPERINPGDHVHRLETIVKVVSGMDQESLETIAAVYGLVVEAGIYQAESIKVAEAAKVIENSQRDINIAFMNELSMIFSRLGIDTQAVLNAAGTKWNFLKFQPGLVGGHCIGIDPYYLTYKAEQAGYHSQIILSGRRINDDMGKYVVESLVKLMIKSDISIKTARIAILGFTFKENCPDTRNTRVIDIVNELKEYGISPMIVDPQADAEEAMHEYGLSFEQIETIRDVDVVIIAVGHRDFIDLDRSKIDLLFRKNNQVKILMDIKGILNRQEYTQPEFLYWRL